MGPGKNHYWQPAEDESMRLLYTAGETWSAIARAFGVSKQSVQARGARLGLTWREEAKKRARLPGACTIGAEAVPAFVTRPPLPAGHPITWSAIIMHTPTLWGLPYGRP